MKDMPSIKAKDLVGGMSRERGRALRSALQGRGADKYCWLNAN
jgi:hypothetical protein